MSHVFLLEDFTTCHQPPIPTGTCWLWQCCHHWNIGSCQALPPTSSWTKNCPTESRSHHVFFIFSTLKVLTSSWIVESQLQLEDVFFSFCSIRSEKLHSDSWYLDASDVRLLLTYRCSLCSWRHSESPNDSTGNSQSFQCKELTEGLYTLKYDFYLLPCIQVETIRKFSGFRAVTMMLLWLTFSDVVSLWIH